MFSFLVSLSGSSEKDFQLTWRVEGKPEILKGILIIPTNICFVHLSPDIWLIQPICFPCSSRIFRKQRPGKQHPRIFRRPPNLSLAFARVKRQECTISDSSATRIIYKSIVTRMAVWIADINNRVYFQLQWHLLKCHGVSWNPSDASRIQFLSSLDDESPNWRCSSHRSQIIDWLPNSQLTDELYV